MNNMFLGKPPTSIEAWIKGQPIPPPPTFEGDIYVLDDGSEVKVSKDDPLAQGAIKISILPDNLSNDIIAKYKYGVGHSSISNIVYKQRNHEIDLTNTNIKSFSGMIDIGYNKLTNFLLPATLQSFDDIYIDNNELSILTLPISLSTFSVLFAAYNNKMKTLIMSKSLLSFNAIDLDNTCNIDCTACVNVPSIQGHIKSGEGTLWQGTVLVRDAAQKAAFDADYMWKKYKIQVK